MTTTTETLGPAAPISRAEMALNRRMQEDDHRIAQDNVTFADANPEQKRVIIAKDVLKWLDLGKIIPESMTYLYPSPSERLHNERVNEGKCHACALGAVFACTVERQGGLSGFWGKDSAEMAEHLSPYFDKRQLTLIEDAFEGFDRISDDEGVRATNFARGKRWDARQRMTAIMKNIIANRGTFVP